MAAHSKSVSTIDAALSAKLIGRLSQETEARECLQWFAREKQWINEKHLQLCRIPAPTFFEQKRAEWMLEQFRALGCIARIDRGGNVIAHPFENREGPFLAVTAHLDTVLAPRNPDEITFRGDGRLYGPGVSDNGAGLTALLAIARAVMSCVSDKELFAPLVLIANIGEEGEGNLSGMRYLCRQSATGSKVRSFLILDGPATDHITAQALASRRFEVAIAGPGGHSWSDYGIVNPVHALSRAIVSFADHRLHSQGTPRSSYNFGVMQAGASINSIPTEARAKVDIRSENAARLDELSSLLTACVERAIESENERASAGRLSAKIKEIGSRPGGRLPESAFILESIHAVDAHLGIRSHVDCASTDANIPLSLGLPAISIGAGGHGGGAHTPQEWFSPEGRELGLRRIFLLLYVILRNMSASLEGITPGIQLGRNGE